MRFLFTLAAVASLATLPTACSSKPPATDDTGKDAAGGDDDDSTPTGDDDDDDGDASTPKDAASDAKKDVNVVDAGPVTASAEVIAACKKMATAFCGIYTRCTGDFATKAGFGTSAKCAERTALACASRLTAKGTKMDVAWATKCAAGAPSISCSDFAVQKLDACATPPGTVDNGQPCGEDGQCKSTFCGRAPDSICGTCSPLSTAGSACVGGTNGACSTGFLCNGTKCAALKNGKAGDRCTGNQDCNVLSGLGCAPFLGCKQATLAEEGETCGIEGTSFSVCSAAGTCKGDSTCGAAAADGEDCSIDSDAATTGKTGQTCMGPAVCQGGKCTLPNAAACK